MDDPMMDNPMMMMMPATFVLSQSTPLYFTSWMPNSMGSYAGTCIFLIILAAIFRGLLAYRHILELRWRQNRIARRPIVVAQERNSVEESKTEGTEGASLPPRPQQGEKWTPDQWRVSVDIPRAFVVMVTVGVGYLLMLAVMTLNVGYFLSVLAGTFLSELGVGRYGTGGQP